MVDNTNPTSQFHAYQPQDAIPQTEKPASALSNMLSQLGVAPSKIDAIDRSTRGLNLEKARGFARNNGGLVLGGLAALVIGAGLLRRKSK